MRRWLLVVAAVVVAAAVVGPLLLRAAGRFLVEEQAPARADAIVVLTGSYPDRILEAVQLYRDGYAPRIILCREPENAGFRKLRALGVRVPRIFELNRMVAEQLGVPPDAIAVVDRPAGSTYSEAEVVLEYMLQHGYHSMLLVTSKYHTRRAGLIYRHLADGRVHVSVRPAREDDFQPEGWWRDRASTRRVVIEYQKLLTFLLLDRWRLPPVPAQPVPSPVERGTFGQAVPSPPGPPRERVRMRGFDLDETEREDFHTEKRRHGGWGRRDQSSLDPNRIDNDVVKSAGGETQPQILRVSAPPCEKSLSDQAGEDQIP